MTIPIPWSPHPVQAIETLIVSGTVDAMVSGLAHPAVRSDPYARLRLLDRLRTLRPDDCGIEQQWLQALLLGNRPALAWRSMADWPRERLLAPGWGLMAAQTAHTLGLRDNAQRLFNELNDAHPGSVDILQKMAEFDPGLIDETRLGVLMGMHRRSDDPYVREKAGFALATVLQSDEPARAFQLATDAHALKRSRAGTWNVVALHASLQQDARWPPRPAAPLGTADVPRPLLVVGAPRSGTTLVSSLLGAHPELANLGEQNLLGALASGPASQPAARSDSRLPAFASAWYRAATADMAGDALASIDKLPSNAERCGLAQALLGDALVLHIQRDPRDCMTSIHMHDFEHGLAYSSDLGDIARYLHALDAHMSQWAARAPDRILRISFEALVAAPEQVLAPVLRRLGLDWDPRMLDFWRDGQQPGTYSAGQVRQPLNRAGIGRWQRLGDAAAPILRALAQASC